MLLCDEAQNATKHKMQKNIRSVQERGSNTKYSPHLTANEKDASVVPVE
jgi:hypothetical protein